MLVTSHKPLLQLFLLPLNERVLVLHLELAVDRDFVNLLVKFLSDDAM